MKAIVQFLTHDLWRIRMENEPFSRRVWLFPLRLVMMTFREFNRDQCSLQASALTFYTLLSIVPVLALAFGVAKGFGLHRTLEAEVRKLASGGNIVEIDPTPANEPDMVTTPTLTAEASATTEGLAMDAMASADDASTTTVTNLTEGQAQVVDQAINFASNMLDNAQGGVVAGLGVIVLLWTVIKLLGNIEYSFNIIWHVREGRSWVRKLSDYLSVMMISPVLFLISTSATAFLASRFLMVVEGNEWLAILGGPTRFALLGLPSLLFGLLFAFVYLFMPNTRVNPSSALYGGLFAGVLYQLTQYAYVRFQIGISGANAIYGTFAALPLFLTWLQLSWMIVLLGAEFAYSHQYAHLGEVTDEEGPLSPRARRLVALCLAKASMDDFAAARPAPAAEELAARLAIPMGTAKDVLGDLVEAGVLSEVVHKGGINGYQPAAEAQHLKIGEVIARLDALGRNDVPLAETEDRRQIESALEALQRHLRESDWNAALR